MFELVLLRAVLLPVPNPINTGGGAVGDRDSCLVKGVLLIVVTDLLLASHDFTGKKETC